MEQEFALSYTSELSETKKKLDKSDNRKIIEFEGKKVVQIEPDNYFNLLVHSTDAGFVNENKLTAEESLKSKWKSSDLTFNHVISMTYINQDFLGMAPVGENGVIYGFTSLDSKNVRLMENTDINTYSNEFGYSASQKKYLTAQSMPYNSRRLYSEVGVERSKTNPDYVIIFDDSTEQAIKNAYKAATEWDIPVILLDKEKIKDRQIERLEEFKKNFEETRNPDKLHELLNTYETNMAGWLLNRKQDEQDQSFTKSINNERFREEFDEEYSKITSTMENYLEGFEQNHESTQDLVRAMQIVLQEHDLYETCDKVKLISKTQSTIKTEKIIEKINETMERVGMQEYIVDEENIPTKKQYDISIQNLLKNALREVQIGIEDVRDAEAQLAKDKSRESEKVVPNR